MNKEMSLSDLQIADFLESKKSRLHSRNRNRRSQGVWKPYCNSLGNRGSDRREPSFVSFVSLGKRYYSTRNTEPSINRNERPNENHCVWDAYDGE